MRSFIRQDYLPAWVEFVALKLLMDRSSADHFSHKASRVDKSETTLSSDPLGIEC